MTIPQQECREKSVPKCEQVSKEECKMVPKEKCTVVKGEIKPGQCRINTRLECQDKPKQKCGKKVTMIILSNQVNSLEILFILSIISGSNIMSKDPTGEMF